MGAQSLTVTCERLGLNSCELRPRNGHTPRQWREFIFENRQVTDQGRIKVVELYQQTPDGLWGLRVLVRGSTGSEYFYFETNNSIYDPNTHRLSPVTGNKIHD